MMEYNLNLRSFIERANTLFPRKEVIAREYFGTFKYTYADVYQRVKKLAHTLEKLGVQPGDKVGTLAWNHHRHLELYFAVPCFGAILHTLNLRLSPSQLAYIINHAEDKVIFIDKDLVPLLQAIKDQIVTVKHIIVMPDAQEITTTGLNSLHSYEELMEQADPDFTFPDINEWAPAAMCYTTATTGNPKGVVYTHRAIVLHSLTAALPDTLGISESDRIMPFVPMFHVNAWGLPYIATWLGATQIFPGPRPTPEDICQIIEEHRATLAAGVPTVWMATLALWEAGKYNPSSLNRVVCGGSAASKALISAYKEKLNLPIVHAYGMTETSPIVLVSRPKSYMETWSDEEKLNLSSRQGLLVPGLEMKCVKEDGTEIAWDGREMGELLLKGPWITKEYYNNPEGTQQAIRDGWLCTGDIVTVDPEGYVQIADRAKDLIKSGGEWISSIDLENMIMSFPGVAEAAVIGIPHPKWVERPLACVVLKDEQKGKVSVEDILNFLQDKVSKIWIPDNVEFMDVIPKTSVGKFDKKVLRARYEQVDAEVG